MTKATNKEVQGKVKMNSTHIPFVGHIVSVPGLHIALMPIPATRSAPEKPANTHPLHSISDGPSVVVASSVTQGTREAGPGNLGPMRGGDTNKGLGPGDRSGDRGQDRMRDEAGGGRGMADHPNLAFGVDFVIHEGKSAIPGYRPASAATSATLVDFFGSHNQVTVLQRAKGTLSAK